VTPKKNPVIVFLIVLIVIGIVFVAYKIVMQGGSFSGLEPFPTIAYKQTPSNFLGNRYGLSAQIDSQLAWDENIGKILAVTPMGDAGLALPVFLPKNLDQNMHVGQRYHMQVMVSANGLITIQKIDKF